MIDRPITLHVLFHDVKLDMGKASFVQRVQTMFGSSDHSITPRLANRDCVLIEK